MISYDNCLDEVTGLVNQLCNGELTATGLAQLDQYLAKSDTALRYYIEYLDSESQLLCELTGMPAAMASEMALPTVTDLASEATPLTSQPEPARPALISFLSAAFPGTIGYSSGWPVAYLIATVITGLWILSFWLMPVSRPGEVVTHSLRPAAQRALAPEPLPAAVGRITGLVDCTWLGGSRVSLGQKCQLATGLMEITYDTGAKVILQGPVTYEVESNGGYLSIGKLTGKLETKTQDPRPKTEADIHPSSFILHPFVIRTPSATVTDLGTEFGVAVAKDGTAEVHVYQGEVISRPCTVGDDSGAAVHVTEGHAVRIEPQGAKPLSVTFGRGLFAREMGVPRERRAEAAYIDAVLADRPLAYWPLNEPNHFRRCRDRSGHGFHGTVMGDALTVQSSPVPGKSNAVEFSGNQWIDFGRQDRLAFLTAFTVEAWIWIGATDHGRFISADPAFAVPAKSGWSVGYLATSEEHIHNRGPCLLFTLYGVRDFAFDTVAVPTQKWIHAVFVCRPGKAVDLFLDGQHRASLAEAKMPIVQPVWLAIGRTAGGLFPTLPWHGRLAQVAVYEHPLTESQIENHYRQVVAPPTRQ